MKKIALITSVLFLTQNIWAQKIVYDAHAELRKVESFRSIKVSDGLDAHLTYGDEAVAVSAGNKEGNSFIRTEVINGVLHIGMQRNDHKKFWKFNHNAAKVYVAYTTLERVEASGGSDIITADPIKGYALNIHVNGGSDFKGAVHVEKLKIDGSGGSDISLMGVAKHAEISVSGGSDFLGYELTAETGKIQASGASDVQITATKELEIHASGASDVFYKGDATIKEVQSSGASSVSKKM